MKTSYPWRFRRRRKRSMPPRKKLHGGPNLVSRKRRTVAAMNQPNLIIVARHGGQLSTHGLQGDEESAIHDRDSNIHSRLRPLKPPKTGISHLAENRNFSLCVDTNEN